MNLYCIICLMTEGETTEAVLVTNGQSVCESEIHIRAASSCETLIETIRYVKAEV